MRIGKWSEFSVVRVFHSRSVAIAGVAMDRSGEEGFPWEGSLVGESVLSRTRLELRSASWMSLPRAAARESPVWEYPAGLWALKSPRIMLSPRGVKSKSSVGVKLEGHDDIGGM